MDKNNIGRNDKCYCGSGQKYKKCHYNIDRGFFYDAKSNSWYRKEEPRPQILGPDGKPLKAIMGK